MPHVVGVGAESRTNPYTGKIDRSVEVTSRCDARVATKTEFKDGSRPRSSPLIVWRASPQGRAGEGAGPLAVLLRSAPPPRLWPVAGRGCCGRLSIVEVQSSSELGEAVHGDEASRASSRPKAMDAAS